MRAYTHEGCMGTPTTSQHNIFDAKKLSQCFCCAPDGVRTSGLWISIPTLYQPSHSATPRLRFRPFPYLRQASPAACYQNGWFRACSLSVQELSLNRLIEGNEIQLQYHGDHCDTQCFVQGCMHIIMFDGPSKGEVIVKARNVCYRSNAKDNTKDR